MPRARKAKLYRKARHLAHIRDARGKLPKYAWPGGYPMFYVTERNSVLCPDCANKEGAGSDDPPVAHDANWEDPSLYCDGCNDRIESAYAEKD
jgi:hypothetical protein